MKIYSLVLGAWATSTEPVTPKGHQPLIYWVTLLGPLYLECSFWMQGNQEFNHLAVTKSGGGNFALLFVHYRFSISLLWDTNSAISASLLFHPFCDTGLLGNELES